MSKLTIPAILAVTVMVAGIFAFMPVEQASTVHTTIGVLNVATSDDVVPTVTADIIGDSATIKTGNVCTVFQTEAADANNEVVSLEITAGGDAIIIIADNDLEAGLCEFFTGFRVFYDGAGLAAGDTLDFTVSWRASTP